ncbi:hypothetical protein GH890_30160, partial [Bacillus thuringiensis]|nr:hypothetical protein [Bacillus thuringiensis]
DNIKAAFRKSKVAYNSFTDLEYMAGKTKDGFNRTMDGINAGVGRAKDMFGDSDPNYMGDDPSEHTADESGTKQATLDEEKVSGESEEEKLKFDMFLELLRTTPTYKVPLTSEDLLIIPNS